MNQKPTQQLTAEIVSIGDEMTSGARLDTNAQWLAQRLGELGILVTFCSTVDDTLSHNVDVFRIAASRADLVVATGGLGPTRDDLTREALAKLTNHPLEFRQSAMDHIESMFAKRNRDMPERNRVQAMFPVGSQEIVNPQGTAPGVDLSIDRHENAPSRIFALPGVPAEMKRMFDETVAPRILEHSGAAIRIKHAVMKFFGVGESEMESRLGDMISRERQPRVGITVSTATISLRIVASAESDEACQQMIDATRKEILERVPEYYFGEGERFEQHHAIDAILREKDQSLAIVEFGCAAPLGDWFATLGHTPAYRGALSLGSSADLLKLVDAKSMPEALQLVCQRFDANWVLAIDAYPQVDRNSDQPAPATEVRLMVGSRDGTTINSSTKIGGHPDVLLPRVGKSGMAWLRTVLSQES